MVQPQHDAQPSVEPSTEALLIDCARGSQDSFRQLYAQLASTAYGLALRVLRDDQLAQDAVQEAFTQVWTESSTFDSDRASGRAWIMTLVHRRAVDRVRREESDRNRGRTWGAKQVVPQNDSVAEIVELHAEHRHVRAALGRLTARQREALELAYDHGFTQAQIAAHLDIPIGTAKTRLRDGLHSLRRELEETP